MSKEELIAERDEALVERDEAVVESGRCEDALYAEQARRQELAEALVRVTEERDAARERANEAAHLSAEARDHADDLARDIAELNGHIEYLNECLDRAIAERDEAREEVVRLGRENEKITEELHEQRLLVADFNTETERLRGRRAAAAELLELERATVRKQAEWMTTAQVEIERLQTIIRELGASEAAEPPPELQLATPFAQCGDETPHGEHEWFDMPFRRQCGGFVGRAGVARPLCYGGPGCASLDASHWALYDHKPAEPPEGIEALRPGGAE